MKKKFRSDAFAAIHETACDLHEAGAMDIRTLRKFDKMCLTPVHPMTPEDIRLFSHNQISHIFSGSAEPQ